MRHIYRAFMLFVALAVLTACSTPVAVQDSPAVPAPELTPAASPEPAAATVPDTSPSPTAAPTPAPAPVETPAPSSAPAVKSPNLPDDIDPAVLRKGSILTADTDLVIERDMFTAYMDKGSKYTEFELDALDIIMKELENVTGLSFSTSKQRGKLKVCYRDVATNIAASGSGAYVWDDGSTVTMYFSNGGPWWPELNAVIIGVNGLVHEAAHAIHLRNYGYFPYPSISEGFAVFMEGVVLNNLGWPTAISFAELSQNTYDVNIVHSLIDTDFEGWLVSSEYNYGFEKSDGIIGEHFFIYIYSNFGMDKVLDVLNACVDTRPTRIIKAISDTLGVDVLKDFPLWCMDNPFQGIERSLQN